MRSLLYIIALAGYLPLVLMCADDTPSNKSRVRSASPTSPAKNSNNNLDEKDLDASEDAEGANGATNLKAPPLGGTNEKTPDIGPTSAPSPTPTPTAGDKTGETYFNDVLRPMFETAPRCYSCHAPPRTNPLTPATLSIYSYELLKRQLAIGPSSTDNNAYNKMRGRITHGGGDRCDTGPDKSPCLELSQWWKLEYPNAVDLKSAGELKTISDTGIVSGFAQDLGNAATVVPVRLYLDGATGAGALVATTQSDKPGYGTANKAFVEPIPAASIDGKEHKLYAYGVINGKEQQLIGSPKAYTAYKPNSGAGKTFFDANVSAGLNSCGGCHGARDYQGAWSSLLSPTKQKGGSAVNNSLILKLSGGLPHSGGNVCGSASGGVCAQLQAWYLLEFP